LCLFERRGKQSQQFDRLFAGIFESMNNAGGSNNALAGANHTGFGTDSTLSLTGQNVKSFGLRFMGMGKNFTANLNAPAMHGKIGILQRSNNIPQEKTFVFGVSVFLLFGSLDQSGRFHAGAFLVFVGL